MKAKYIWKGVLTYSVGNYPSLTITGMEPFDFKDNLHKAWLLSTGVFEDLGDKLRYIGPVTLQKKDGTKAVVSRDGTCELDPDELDDTRKELLGGEFQLVGG